MFYSICSLCFKFIHLEFSTWQVIKYSLKYLTFSLVIYLKKLSNMEPFPIRSCFVFILVYSFIELITNLIVVKLYYCLYYTKPSRNVNKSMRTVTYINLKFTGAAWTQFWVRENPPPKSKFYDILQFNEPGTVYILLSYKIPVQFTIKVI